VQRHGFGGDRERILVAGHSSGAHMAAVALTTDWAGGFGLPADLLGVPRALDISFCAATM
jgi:acetyl esterase/lipase